MAHFKRFNSRFSSIDVVDLESHIVICHFRYCPLVSGDYESARALAIQFVSEFCRRHNFDVASYQFVDDYHCSCFSLSD